MSRIEELPRWFFFFSALEAMDECHVGALNNNPNLVDHNQTDYLNPARAQEFQFAFKFGCQATLRELFITQLADGIMGMDNDKAAYWKEAYDAQVIK